MVIYKDECVGCPPELGCLGLTCPYKDVPYYFCDMCNKEVKLLVKYEGSEYCLNCLSRKNCED